MLSAHQSPLPPPSLSKLKTSSVPNLQKQFPQCVYIGNSGYSELSVCFLIKHFADRGLLFFEALRACYWHILVIHGINEEMNG